MADKQDTPQPIEARINEALKNTDDKGKIVFPEDVDPVFKAAVIAEKKVRDTQASFTRSRQELATLRAEKEVLESQLSSTVPLTAEQTEELEELKIEDPDAYYQKRLKYEQEAKAAAAARLKELTTEASTKALQELTVSQRKEALDSFSVRTGITLTDDVMENDIPPRLQKKINEMPFEDYLEEVAKYLNKGKVVKPTDEGLNQPDLEKLSGGQDENPKTSKTESVIL